MDSKGHKDRHPNPAKWLMKKIDVTHEEKKGYQACQKILASNASRCPEVIRH
jgi:hypothetical protein